MPTIIIPTPLRKFTNNNSRLELNANTIQDLVNELTLNFPDLKKHLLDEKGNVRSFINIFVGNDDIRNLQQEQTVLKKDAIISIIPAIAGGTSI
jgi:molybdopterin converting factor small subunit